MKRLWTLASVVVAFFSLTASAQFVEDYGTSTPQRRPNQAPRRVNQTPQRTQPNYYGGQQTTVQPATALRSQFHYQPQQGKHIVTGRFKYNMSGTNVGIEALGTTTQYFEMKHSEMIGEVEYHYGITPFYSAGIILNYGMGEDVKTYDSVYTVSLIETSGTKKFSGLGDVVFFGKGLTPMGKWSLTYGLNFSWAGAKEVGFASATNSTTGNRYSGGMAIEPYAGGQFKFGKKHTVGGQLSYKSNFERTASGQLAYSSSNTNVSAKTTGGNVIGIRANYETYFGKTYFDPFIGFNMISEETSTGTVTTDSTVVGASKASQSVLYFGTDFTVWQAKNWQWGGGYRGSQFPITAATETSGTTVGRYQIQSYLEHSITLFARFSL